MALANPAGLAVTIVGAVVVLSTTASVFTTLLVPRARQSRAAKGSSRAVQVVIRAWAGTARDFPRTDHRLSLIGPLTLIAQLAVWGVGFTCGFALLLWPHVPDLGVALREAGSSMLTLGFAATPGAAPTIIDLWAGLSGFGLLTLQIAYLPTIYDAFNRREILVTMLESRAGSPPWGPEILLRHRLAALEDDLPQLYVQWERWAADLAESHTNYPVLLTLRSPHLRRFWLLSLIAVMDAAALHLALFPATAPSSARLCIRMGFTALRDIAQASGIAFDEDPRPDGSIALTYEEFAAGVAHATSTGLRPERTARQAWADFHGWRVNWESIAHQLAHDLGAPPSLWSGPRWFDHETLYPSRPRHRRPDDPDAVTQVNPDYQLAQRATSALADAVHDDGSQA